MWSGTSSWGSATMPRGNSGKSVSTSPAIVVRVYVGHGGADDRGALPRGGAGAPEGPAGDRPAADAAGREHARRRRARPRVAGREPRGEPPRGDLGRRPPQALVGDEALALAPGRLRPQVARAVLGAQDRAQRRPVRARRAVRAGARGDPLGDGIGLLGGDAALLERARGPVADRVDVVVPAGAQVVVDEQEAGPVVGQARDARAGEQRPGGGP